MKTMGDELKILTINPGSTSTKVALFQGAEELFSANIAHEAGVLKTFPEINDQFDYRRENILKVLGEHEIDLREVDAFSGRGGGLVALEGGTYVINEKLLEHARAGFTIKHPAMLGSQLAHSFATLYGKPAFVVNPPDVDEFQLLARVTGLKNVTRESRVHALNQKEIGLRYAQSIGKNYEDLNLIIAHIGGGVSVTAHRRGKMVDSNDVANGDGPMAPTRCGSIPVHSIVKMCFSGEYTEKEMLDKTTKTGGLVDHLNTADVLSIVKMIEAGDPYAELIFDGMIYQIVKAVGSMAAVLKGDVDGIILTGGISYNEYLVEEITAAVSFIAKVTAMPGEFEMEALASGAIRVLTGLEKPLSYTGIPVWQGFEK
jgi:butyrate kinase